jgi:hypothetical protein
MAEKSLAQVVAVLVGVVYTAIGIIGFGVTGFTDFFSSTAGKTLAGFGINPFHNLVHLAIGLYLLWAATRDTAVTEGALIGGGGVYVVAAITGFIYAHIPVLSIVTSGAADNYLHLVSGVTAMLVGVISAAATQHKRRDNVVAY